LKDNLTQSSYFSGELVKCIHKRYKYTKYLKYNMGSQKPKVVVSKELKDKLDTLGNKGDTYEDIIWRLIKNANRKDN